MPDPLEVPIVRRMLPHTGRLDGDDTGYRDVDVSPADADDPDPLVALDGLVASYPVYARGARRALTPFYGRGLGGPSQMLARAPVARALVDADERLRGFERRLLVLDAWRPAWVQARLWSAVFERLLAMDHRAVGSLSAAEWLRYGRAADDTASYCRVQRGPALNRERERLLAAPGLLDDAAAGTDVEATADELLTYQANLGAIDLPLDTSASTAHGGGGACDLWLIDVASGAPVNLGVPFDSTSPAAVIDYFEWARAEDYQALVAADPDLSRYLAEHGVEPPHVGPGTMAAVRRERRLLFHVLVEIGATFFSLARETGEPWHFNFGNERGGRQAAVHPGAGSACHSLLRDVRDPATGRWIAVWGNETAHRLAGPLGRRPEPA